MAPVARVMDSKRASDPLFSLFSGLYLAMLLTPPGAVLAIQVGLHGAGVLYVTLISLLAVVTAVGWRVTARTDGVAERLGRTPARWLPSTVGLCYGFGGAATIGHLGVLSAVLMVSGIVAMGLGYALGFMTGTRYADAVLAETETYCEFKAGWPDSARRRAVVAAVPLCLLGVAGFGAIFLGHYWWTLWPLQILLPAGTVLMVRTEPRSYTATAAGLERRNDVAGQLLHWDAFSGYTRTDDALVLHRPWRLDIRLALDDIGDPDVVEAAIATHLGQR